MDQIITFSDEYKAESFSAILSRMCIKHELVDFHIKYHSEFSTIVTAMYIGFEHGLSYYET